MADKKADLAGPGIGNYEELEKILPQDYESLLTRDILPTINGGASQQEEAGAGKKFVNVV